MKPSFALNFTDTSIGLLHRTSRGWLEVGTVPVDEPDLPNALAYLRGSALGLEPRGITTKLVIPNSQIRYMTLAAPGPDAASRRAQIKVELEGKTPYPVDELVFDWSGTGKTVQVAIVARETLEEAESFARDNRFNPVSFVAIPEPGSFGKEPWFGPTALAPTILTEGEKVERDQDPIHIVGRSAKPDAAAPADDAAAVEPAEVTPEQVAAPDSGASGPILPDAPEPLPDSAATGEAPVATLPDVSALPQAGDAPKVIEADAKVEKPLPAKRLAASPVDSDTKPDSGTSPRSLPATEPPAANGAKSEAPDRSAADPAQARVTGGVIDDRIDPLDSDLADLPPIPPARIAAALRADSAKSGPAKTQQTRPGKQAAKGADPRRTGAPVAPPRLTALPGGAAAARVAPNEAEWPLERVAVAARSGKAEPPRRAPIVTAPSITVPRDRKLTVVPPTDVSSSVPSESGKARSEAETMTVFGARQSRQRGKPRYLFLFLVVVLLAILAAIGIWSSIFLASRDQDAPAVAATQSEPRAEETAAAEPVVAEPAVPAAVPALPPETEAEAADDQTTEIASATEAPAQAAPVTAPAAEAGAAADATEPATPIESPAEVTRTEVIAPPPEPEPEPAPVDGSALAAATGTAEANRSPGNDPQDEIFLAVVDARISTSDAAALAPPSPTTDAIPGAQPLPPPFGTLYQFDAEGRIVPTAEGIVTPEGVLLVAGKPPRVPPTRPEAPIPAASSATTDIATPTDGAVGTDAATDAAVAEPFFADPALAGARPRLRPADLAPVVPQTADDDAALTEAVDVRIASLKPRARPAELFARGEEALAAQTAEASAAAQSASASLVAGLADSDVSPLAIAVSRKPAPRPQTIDRSIEAAVQLAAADASLVPDAVAPVLAEPASAAPAPVEPPPAAIALAPAAKPATPRTTPDEPEPTTFSKSEPDETERAEIDEPDSGGTAATTATRSVVAKQATFANALNMSKVSLIGVFGSPSNRYAMVRQPGGRFVKVSVGDRIDGGRVAAISEREVSYVKNGQTHRLSMPRG
jgi:hypothetical protein